ncbi:phenazine biosynthesis-like domain-containing protein 1 [Liolophura sinensis]|uniref:phenazine biosynthesis-like domain-containing protein 1 n=1 Tax=Liolophura sinensis TaxID=3198878 RepID=UPI003158DE54
MESSDRREYPLYTVDAFTAVPFCGNPAAVCVVTEDRLSDIEMQKMAAEVGLSETAFIEADTDEEFKTVSRFRLRWFTPTTEVPLCGHATLASAAVLFFVIGNQSEMLEFDTHSGILATRREGEEITLNFPLNPSTRQVHDRAGRNEDFLELFKYIVDEDKVLAVEYSSTTKKLLLRLHDNVSREFLENLKVDTQQLMKCQLTTEVRGVIVTVIGSAHKEIKAYDFISRYFAPWNGIPEDPVTGSAHTVLASYWSIVLNKTEMCAHQCSPRGGDLRIRLRGDRVELIGQAVVMVTGKLTI